MDAQTMMAIMAQLTEVTETLTKQIKKDGSQENDVHKAIKHGRGGMLDISAVLESNNVAPKSPSEDDKENSVDSESEVEDSSEDEKEKKRKKRERKEKKRAMKEKKKRSRKDSSSESEEEEEKSGNEEEEPPKKKQKKEQVKEKESAKPHHTFNISPYTITAGHYAKLLEMNDD